MKKLVKFALSCALAMTPIVSLASIDSTHHDMNYLTSGVAQKCAYCHSVNLATASTALPLGNVGRFCVLVCHEGGALAGGRADVAAPAVIGVTNTINGAETLSASHGFTPSTLNALGAVDNNTQMLGLGWPHIDSTGANDMECTSCHSVHDGTFPPFLNAPLSGADNAASFCQRCHTGAGASGIAGRYQTITTMGAHPTEFALGATLGQAYGATAGKHARNINASINAALRVGVTGTPADATAFNQQRNATGNGWLMGGHLMGADLPVAQSSTSKVGCYSCHSAHQANDNGTSDVLSNTLVLGPYDSKDGVQTSSVLCLGCHGGEPGTTTFGHPTNTGSGLTGGVYVHNHANHSATSNPNIPTSGNFPIDVREDLNNLTGLSASLLGVGGEVLCVTCHDVHGGMTGRMSLRNIGAGRTGAEWCSNCHGTKANVTQSALTQNRHHPYGAVDASHTSSYSEPAWAATTTASLADGLDCSDCHVFNGTAHNW